MIGEFKKELVARRDALGSGTDSAEVTPGFRNPGIKNSGGLRATCIR